MFEDLGRIADILNLVLIEMKQSNELMTKLTNQLKILTLPPDMKAFDREEWE